MWGNSITPRGALSSQEEIRRQGCGEQSSPCQSKINPFPPPTLSSDRGRCGGCRSHSDADPKDPAWAPGQDLCHALVDGLQVRDAAELLGAQKHVGKKALMRRELLIRSCSSLTDSWSVPHKTGS